MEITIQFLNELILILILMEISGSVKNTEHYNLEHFVWLTFSGL